jgi:hypothetical protein
MLTSGLTTFSFSLSFSLLLHLSKSFLFLFQSVLPYLNPFPFKIFPISLSTLIPPPTNISLHLSTFLSHLSVYFLSLSQPLTPSSAQIFLTRSLPFFHLYISFLSLSQPLTPTPPPQIFLSISKPFFPPLLIFPLPL